MNADRPSFLEASLDAVWDSQWGDAYDGELLDAINRLEQAEVFASMDFEAMKPFIREGDPDSKYWNREWALGYLQAMRTAYQDAKNVFERKVGWREAPAEIVAHHEFMARCGHGPSEGEIKPEVDTIMELAGFLQLGCGVVPSPKVVESLVVALKEIGRRGFDPSMPDDEKRITENELTRPFMAAVNLSGFGMSQLMTVAKRIREAQLFPGDELRIARRFKRYSLPLTPENERSSVFDGILYAGKLPRRKIE